MGLGGGVEGLSKKEKKLMDVDNSVVVAGGEGRRWRRRNRGQMVLEGDLTWGDEHTMQCTDDEL